MPFATATALAKAQAIICNAKTLTKVKNTPQMKDTGEFSASTIAFEAAFAADRGLEGKDVLLLDDLFESGASMNVAAKTLISTPVVHLINT